MTSRPKFTVRRVLSLLLVGVLGGLLSGAFGVGGGIVMVPLLILLAGMDQRRAAATSLAAIVPTAIAGSVTYLANREIDVIAALLIAVGGVLGAVIGSRLLRTLPLGWLRWLFIALLLVVAIRLFFEVPGRGTGFALEAGTIAGLILLGVVMGIASGLFGIGGGIVVVPVLVALFGASDLVAKGTSLLAMIPSAITGTTVNARAGVVDIVDGAIVGVAATLSSFGGVAIAFLLPARVSAILFAILIVLAMVQMIWRSLRPRKA